MQIEVTEWPDMGIYGESELAVTVFSDEVVTWPTVQKALTPEQKVSMREHESAPCYYHPGDPTEPAELGFKYVDIWVFRHRRNSA